MGNIIEIKNLNKVFRGHSVLKNINLNVEKGKCYGIVGRNGSGKSVLFKIICGFIGVTSGEVKVNGKVIGKEVDFPENTGILIENPGYLPNYSAYENLKLLASIKNKISVEDIIKSLNIVGLDWTNKTKVSKYSLGMKQRLGIAQAIMENQEILILDEPMNGLDKSGVYDIRNLLMNLKKENKTILLSSHIEEDVNILCDSVYEMDNGELLEIKNNNK